MRARAALLAALLAPLLTACEEPLSSPDLLRILAGADAADTIDAELLQAVVVEVRLESGEPAANIVVRFDPLMAGDPAYPTVLISTLEGDGYVPGIVDTADSRGRASVRVRLGGVAGPAGLLVTVPELGLQDTARFTVLPGAAVAVTVEPADTALYVGGSYPLRAATVDRRGNLRRDSLSYAAAGDVVTVDGSGNVVGQTIGRGTVVVQAAGAADTARVSVVPQGTLAVRQGYFEPALVVFNLDGSGFDTVLSLPGGSGYMSPDWSPTGDGFVLYRSESGTERIYLVDGSGGRRRLLPTKVGIDRERWPQFSSAGDWVYFIGEKNSLDAVWRVRPDGSGLAQVGPPLAPYKNAAMLAVAPDDARVAYAEETAYPYWGIRVLDVASGAVDTLPVSGYSPRWSPAGDRIAFVQDGRIMLMRPDGTGVEPLTAPDDVYDLGIDWSPDGEWIVAAVIAGLTTDPAIHLIRAASGMTLPLPYTTYRDLREPAWAP